ncbi:MAG: hypothetical protein HGA85_04075 [Nanoarchaeota archaeon]|nr:hypothetical protein [Nanoarchaeota archaeon]
MKNWIVFLVVAGLITACGSGGGTVTGPNVKALYTGTEGVRVSLLNDIREGYEEEMIESAFKVVNKGPYDTRGVIVASVNPAELEFSSGSSVYKKSFSVEGKDPVNPFDKSADFPFALKVLPISVEDNINSKQATILIKACYDYSGLLSSSVCIDKDPSNLNQIEKTCKTKSTVETGGGQGGPLAISKVSYETLIGEDGSIKPWFKIYLGNHGSGEVVSPGLYETACSGSAMPEEANTVTLEDISFSNYNINDFECFPTKLDLPPVKENDEDQEPVERFIGCKLKQGRMKREEGKAYTTDLTIKIRYGYSISLTQQITLKKQV